MLAYKERRVQMVSVEYMVSVALKYDTTLSRAMLRACGVVVPKACAHHLWTHEGRMCNPTQDISISREVFECFTNKASPLDGRVQEAH